MASLCTIWDLLLASVQEANGRARHAKDVGLRHAAYTALYRAATGRGHARLTALRLSENERYKSRYTLHSCGGLEYVLVLFFFTVKFVQKYT